MIDFVRKRTIPVAADDVAYNEHPNHAARERQLLERGLGGSIHQGIYVMTSTGIPLGRVSTGWPDYDPIETLKNTKEAVAKYYRLKPSERMLGAALDPARDKLQFEQDRFTKPAKTLDLRVVRRGYPFNGMNSADQRNPMFFHMDWVWFKPSEWRQWIPKGRHAGAKVSVTGAPRLRWVLHNHHQPGCSAWDETHVAPSEMTSTITEVSGNLVKFRVNCAYKMSANTQWCKDTYTGDLIAYGTYDSGADQITAFEVAMLGTHTVGEMKDHIHRGSPTQQTAMHGTLNPMADADDNMKPSNWKWGYGLDWCRKP